MPVINIKPKYIYIIFLCLMIAVFLFSYSRYEMHIATMASGERSRVRISEVVCAGDRDNQNYVVFRKERENRIVNVGKRICGSLQVGDSIDILYNKGWDLYFPTIINTTDDKWGMAFGATFMLVSIFYLLFPGRAARR